MTKFAKQRQQVHEAVDNLLDEIQRTRFSGESVVALGCHLGGIRTSKIRFSVGTGDATLQVIMDEFLEMRNNQVKNIL